MRRCADSRARSCTRCARCGLSFAVHGFVRLRARLCDCLGSQRLRNGFGRHRLRSDLRRRGLRDGRRLDELVGTRFLLAATERVLEGIEAEARTAVATAETIVVLTDADETIATYLRDYDCEAIVVRPDRYVFGVARGADELGQLVARVPTLGTVAIG